MASAGRYDADPLAAVSAVLALLVAAVYVGLILQEGDQLPPWFVGGLVAAALLSAYGVARTAPWRRAALVVSGVIMVMLGLLGILSIGLPILVAGVLALVSAGRGTPGRPPAR